MVDHLAWAEGYRSRAAKCLLSANVTSSPEFGDCYRQLARYYAVLAELEESYGRRQLIAFNDRTNNSLAD